MTTKKETPVKSIEELTLDELINLQKNIAAAVKKKEEQKARLAILESTKTKFQETYLNVTELGSFDYQDANAHLAQLVEHIQATIKYAEDVARNSDASFSIDICDDKFSNEGYGFIAPYGWNSSSC